MNFFIKAGNLIRLITKSRISNVAEGVAPDDVVTMSQIPYKKYVALLTQTDANAPVATVLENTTGQNFTFTRSDVGTYSIAGSFVVAKTAIFMGVPNGNIHFATVTSATAIALGTRDSLSAPADGGLLNTAIEIRLYN